MSRLATELARRIDQAEKDAGRSFYAVTLETGLLRDLIRQDAANPIDGSWLAWALRDACLIAETDQGAYATLRSNPVLSVSEVRALLDRHTANQHSLRERIRREVAEETARHLRREARQLRGIGLRVRAHELDHQADLLTGRADPGDPDARRRAADEDIADLIATEGTAP